MLITRPAPDTPPSDSVSLIQGLFSDKDVHVQLSVQLKSPACRKTRQAKRPIRQSFSVQRLYLSFYLFLYFHLT